MHSSRIAKKPTVSSSFYDSYTNQPVKWYEIVDSYREHKETYLPMRFENFPREIWENTKKFFQSEETTTEIDDDDQVHEVTQARSDGNVIRITEYNLANEKYDPKISDAVRTHTDAIEEVISQTPGFNKSGSDSQQLLTNSRSPSLDQNRRSHRRHHRSRHSSRAQPPVSYDDCPECRALAAQGFPTLCNCEECRIKRASYPVQAPYCDCSECRNTRRTVT